MIKKGTVNIASLYKGTQEIIKRYKGTLVVYESWKTLTATGVPPLTLANCKNTNLLDYKIYGNSVQDGTPTPDDPIEIQSVGDKTKNLFDYSARTNGYSINENGSLFTAAGDAVSDFIPVEPNTTYYCTQTGSRRGKFFDMNKQPVQTSSFDFSTLNSGTNFTTGATTYYVRFAMSGSSVDRTKIMLTKGSTATEYEPYGKYRIPVTVSGKNKFNINETQITNPKGNYYTPIVTVDGSTLTMKARNANAIQPAYFHCDVGEGNRVTLRVSGILGEGASASNTRVRYSFTNDINYIANGELVGTHLTTKPFSSTEVKTFSVTTNATARYMLICIGIQQKSGGALSEATADFTNIQVEYGNTTTDYENYITPNTTNIYLNEPLRKIGDFADYLDYKNGKVVRQLGYKVFTGNEVWNYESLSGNRNNFYTSVSDATGNRNNKIYSNMFKFYAGGAMDNAYSCMISNAKNLNIRYQDYNNTTDLKAKLSEMYSANKPLYIIYPLGNEAEESVTLPNILLNKGTNVIDVNTTIKPSNMYVEYKGKVG